jgi:hypothetical protein
MIFLKVLYIEQTITHNDVSTRRFFEYCLPI